MSHIQKNKFMMFMYFYLTQGLFDSIELPS